MGRRADNRNLQIPEFILDDQPACANVDPELFFPQETEIAPNKVVSKYVNLATAKQICASCPLTFQCLEYALKNVEIGIWGGTTESQRESLRKRKGISINRKPPTPTVW
jgi:WhiB family transcriptional regulator, redox-sensing transcriptional regulator